jgi:hypothetical protein
MGKHLNFNKGEIMLITPKEYNKYLKDMKKEFPEVSEEVLKKELNAIIGETYLRIVNEEIQKSIK